MKLLKLLFFFITCLSSLLFSQTTDLESIDLSKLNERKQIYKDLGANDLILGDFSNSFLPINLEQLPTQGKVDFEIGKIVRFLNFNTNQENESAILNQLKLINFELNDKEILQQYWSENHLILWKSSQWLLHEKYGKSNSHWLLNKGKEEQVKKELIHFLNLKRNKGFFEFLSSNYYRFTIAALLNLADFSKDQQIKDLATIASKKLVAEVLKFTNNQGMFFPTTGRGFPKNFSQVPHYDLSSSLYLLTGFGQKPLELGYSDAFLVTTSVDFTNEMNAWKPKEDEKIVQGGEIRFTNQEEKELSEDYRQMTKWSAGNYFGPKDINSSIRFIAKHNLYNHEQFSFLKPVSLLLEVIGRTRIFPFNLLPPIIPPAISFLARSYSTSSVLNAPTIVNFKNNSITMSSVQNYFKGKSGGQQMPIVANTGTAPVFTISGNYTKDLKNPGTGRDNYTNNTHLPYVEQRSNVALVMYNPDIALFVNPLDQKNRTVNLKWDKDYYSKTVEYQNWIIGEDAKNESYIAVRRPCIGYINELIACNKELQAWVYVVGNKDMYGSFEKFVEIIKKATFKDNSNELIANKLNFTYTAEINILGTTLKHKWSDNVNERTSKYIPITNSGIATLASPRNITNNEATLEDSNSSLVVYPVPAKNFITIDSSPFINLDTTLEIYNIQGLQVFNKNLSQLKDKYQTIDTSKWIKGVYFIKMSSNNKTMKQKIVVEN